MHQRCAALFLAFALGYPALAVAQPDPLVPVIRITCAEVRADTLTLFYARELRGNHELPLGTPVSVVTYFAGEPVLYAETPSYDPTHAGWSYYFVTRNEKQQMTESEWVEIITSETANLRRFAIARLNDPTLREDANCRMDVNPTGFPEHPSKPLP